MMIYLRHKAKSLDHKKYVTVIQMSYQVIFHVELNLYSKFHANPSCSSKDIRQNHWTMKNKSH